MSNESLFTTATGHDPYPYQLRLATGRELPQLLSIPTGMGKTAAVVLAWLYRRRYAGPAVRDSTPRRLVYCLPMRTLVEQTRDAVQHWLFNLGIGQEGDQAVSVHVLMGGTVAGDWYEHPQRDAILIGTQDMLLSRALNRGYGMSRYRWPVDFALLNNDCLWVLDETQLMGVGVKTSAQLAGLRDRLATYGAQHTLWMSATLDARLIETVDHRRPENGAWLAEMIEDDDRAHPRVQQLLNARKSCRPADVVLSAETKKDYARQLSEFIQAKHQAGTLTLVVLNRVARAQTVFAHLQKLLQKSEAAPEIALIHSRFRPVDRVDIQSQALNEDNLTPSGRIVIATQAIEAGVDLSATTLITELAPWSSLVQRFGRCNRRGKCGTDGQPAAQVFWVDIATDDDKSAEDHSLPYPPEDLTKARAAIAKLEDVGPATLVGIVVEQEEPVVHVLRRKDLIELFDTTPDLSGNDLDVSRYIREADDTDVLVYWREWDFKERAGGLPPKSEKVDGRIAFPAPEANELCAVAIGALRGKSGFVKKAADRKLYAYTWNPLQRDWRVVNENEVRPGMTLLLHGSTGGYDNRLGWTGDAKHGPVPDRRPEFGQLEDAMDREETESLPITVAAHLRDVGREAEKLRDDLQSDFADVPWPAVVRAAWWHDVGKGHPAFQGAIRAQNDSLDSAHLWAKSGRQGYLRYQIPADADSETPGGGVAVAVKQQRRPGFRHELASALAWLQQYGNEPDANLIAYLIAAHHGKVRLSIRSMPNEKRPDPVDRLFARGIWDRDRLPRIEIGNQQQDVSREVELTLELMQLGESSSGPSWLARALELRDSFGPFRLAFLEMLVCVADWRGSSRGAEVTPP